MNGDDEKTETNNGKSLILHSNNEVDSVNIETELYHGNSDESETVDNETEMSYSDKVKTVLGNNDKSKTVDSKNASPGSNTNSPAGHGAYLGSTLAGPTREAALMDGCCFNPASKPRSYGIKPVKDPHVKSGILKL